MNGNSEPTTPPHEGEAFATRWARAKQQAALAELDLAAARTALGLAQRDQQGLPLRRAEVDRRLARAKALREAAAREVANAKAERAGLALEEQARADAVAAAEQGSERAAFALARARALLKRLAELQRPGKPRPAPRERPGALRDALLAVLHGEAAAADGLTTAEMVEATVRRMGRAPNMGSARATLHALRRRGLATLEEGRWRAPAGPPEAP